MAVEDDDQTQAEGEVLEGTISDGMIPYSELGQDVAPALLPPVTPTAGAAPTGGGARDRAAASPRPTATSTARAPRATPPPAADPGEPPAGQE